MSKIKALYVNEMIKIIHRPSVIVVATVTFTISIIFPILMLIVFGNGDYTASETDAREMFKQQLSEHETAIRNTTVTTKTETVEIEVNGQTKSYQMTLYTGNDIPDLFSNRDCEKDILANYDFDKYPFKKTWLATYSYVNYRNAVLRLYNLEMVPFEERDADWLKDYDMHSSARDMFRKAMFEHSYEYYAQGLEIVGKENWNDSRTSPNVIRQLRTSDPDGELDTITAFYMIDYLGMKQENQERLDNGIEFQGYLPRILTEKRIKELKESNLILEYKFNKHDRYDDKSSACIQVNYMTGTVAQYALTILLVLIAGSAISQEMATGSIKSLIIAPVRRWKIYVAKLLSIITWMVMASVLISVLSVLSTGIAWGFDKLPPYLYVSGGVVREFPYLPSKILFDLTNNISTFFYAFVALTISCYTKNTGVSVGVPVGMVLLHQVPKLLTDTEIPPRILDFMPVANMDLAQRIFPYIRLMVIDDEFSLFESSSFNLPIWFSAVYVIILTFTVLLIGYEEFTRKDIT